METESCSLNSAFSWTKVRVERQRNPGTLSPDG
jgi:hypothetical protein